MWIWLCRLVAVVFVLLISLNFVGSSKIVEKVSESKPAISADVSLNDVEITEDTEPSQPEEPVQTEPVPTEPVHIAVEGVTLNKYSVAFMQGLSDTPIATVHPSNATNMGVIWTSNNTAVATVDNGGRITGVGVGGCTVTVRSADNPNIFADIAVTVTPYVAPVEPELTYINGILIANKTYPLPSTYNPGVDPVANAALQEMFAAARVDGLNLFVVSGFRSYSTQKALYNSYVRRDGAAAADRYSARPGHSEHQTGLAFDINNASSSFAGTPEANWLAANSYKYGFIVRYPEGKEAITGYKYEPWHIRYIGLEAALAVYSSGLCLEEVLGITSCYQ